MSWRHIKDELRKGRKNHQCLLCGLPIETWDTHVVRSGIHDNKRVTMRMHLECERLTHSWREDDWEYNASFEDFREMLNEARNAKVQAS
jgi:hypothetical protein